MEALSNILDSKTFAAITGVVFGIILTAWREKRKKQRDDLRAYLGWLHGLEAETDHLKKVILEITGIMQAIQPGGLCTKRLNHDFLEKARMAIFGYDVDAGFLETLTNAYRDVVHTNDMIERHEQAVMNNRDTAGIHGSVLASMQGVNNSVEALRVKLSEKLKTNQELAVPDIYKRILRILSVTLQAVGALSLTGVVVIVIWFFLSTRPGNAKIDRVTPEKAAFILNWADIGKKAKITKVLHSYQSARSFTGDHVDAYSLQIDNFPEEVVRKDETGRVHWLKPPLNNSILVEAVNTAAMSAESDNLKWFPTAKELNSGRFYLRFQSVLLHDQYPTSVQLTAYDRIDHKIYHADLKL
jgi:hypothetical protein